MLQFVDRWQTKNLHSFTPREDAIADFLAHTDNFMKKTIWVQECRSWYKIGSATARVSALWPGSSLHYIEAMKEPCFKDWNFKYAGNRFAFLGNGYSQTELDTSCDSGYYIRNTDDGVYSSRMTRREILTRSGSKQAPGPNLVGWAPENANQVPAANLSARL
jgi:hypothetical protein